MPRTPSTKMRTMFRSITTVLGLAVVVALGAAAFRVATNWSPSGAGPAPVIAGGSPDANSAADAAVEAFAQMGYNCVQQAAFSHRAPAAKWLQPLQDLAVKAGGPGHWIDSTTRTGWIGSRAEAVEAMNAVDLPSVAEASGSPWVRTTKNGMPVAYSLYEVVLPNGWSIWYMDDYVKAVACGDR